MGARLDTQRHEMDKHGSPPPNPAHWPDLQGLVAMLFISRSGSSAMARHITEHFDGGIVRESLNISPLARQRAEYETADLTEALKRHVQDNAASGWFAFKAGPFGLASGELTGFTERYQHLFRYILLLRRDIIAQAVSITMARATGLYHSGQQERRPLQEDDFKPDEIMRHMQQITQGSRALRDYIAISGRPWRAVLYEDFDRGNCGPLDHALREFGLPERTNLRRLKKAPLERVTRAENAIWVERMRTGLDDSGRALIRDYQDFVDRTLAESAAQ